VRAGVGVSGVVLSVVGREVIAIYEPFISALDYEVREIRTISDLGLAASCQP
jgi:hypothetical protein